ncbi:hypothetical protein SASPL_145520 [Salvia splendens]|uniref:Uncharacterized protein n=1 Tax=Salvia splendens TaxID=180675 RepID=A0A8X8WJ18_SALSN|nr:hypothetical protein SASPL_145520 [Salvia splendens]
MLSCSFTTLSNGCTVKRRHTHDKEEAVAVARAPQDNNTMQLPENDKRQAVAGNVVRVVVALPPRDADSGEAVAGEDLDKSIGVPCKHDLVMAGVVAEPAALDPQKPHGAASEGVEECAVAENDDVEAEGEEHCDGVEGE